MQSLPVHLQPPSMAAFPSVTGNSALESERFLETQGRVSSALGCMGEEILVPQEEAT